MKKNTDVSPLWTGHKNDRPSMNENTPDEVATIRNALRRLINYLENSSKNIENNPVTELLASLSRLENACMVSENDPRRALFSDHLISWLLFDVPFGEPRLTLAARLLLSGEQIPCYERKIISLLADSYSAFYVIERSPETTADSSIGFLEVATGKRFSVTGMDGPYTIDCKTGEIWLTRLARTEARTFLLATPVVFRSGESRKVIEEKCTDFLERFRRDFRNSQDENYETAEEEVERAFWRLFFPEWLIAIFGPSDRHQDST